MKRCASSRRRARKTAKKSRAYRGSAHARVLNSLDRFGYASLMSGADYFSRPRPRLFGHRGAAGSAPENTLPSFERARADGADYFELDVHATRDGVVVV